MSRQWNFLPWRPNGSLPTSAGGIDAVGGWRNLISARRPGARGVTVAVVDTGIAYRSVGRRYRRNPDFQPWQFARGYDFVLGNRWPLDRNGHGTHIAGTIGQQTDNGIGLTGLAYNARLMPIRVLDVRGNGTSDRIADGIRWAADRGADVINMSFNFGCGDRVPNVEAAIVHAYRQGAVLVASVGNAHAERCISAPAGLPPVIGVGGTTEGGCLGNYSLHGPGLDLVAPGGGRPVPGFGCAATGARPIYQLTFRRPGDRRRFGVPSRYFGTSMAAAHVSGAAAMVLASGAVGRDPSPRAVRRQLLRTARQSTSMPRLPGFGAGILDVGAATERRRGPRPLRPAR